MGRACVYTCLIGGYEALNEQPVAADSGLDFLCFTDDPGLTSASWRIVPHAPAFPLDPVRSQRVAKLSPQDLLPDYDVSLYIDNSVILKVPPEQVLARYLPAGTRAAMPGHSFRASVCDEFLEVIRLGFDDGPRVLEQLNHYLMSEPEALEAVPFWSAIILRRHHDPAVIAAMRLWLAHVLRYSRRDQLSGAVVMGRSGLDVARVEIDNLESWFHRWPVAEKRDRDAFPFSPVKGQMPAVVLAQEWQRTQSGLEQRIAGLEQALAAAQSEAGDLRAVLAAGMHRPEGPLPGAVMVAGEADPDGGKSSDSQPVAARGGRLSRLARVLAQRLGV